MQVLQRTELRGVQGVRSGEYPLEATIGCTRFQAELGWVVYRVLVCFLVTLYMDYSRFR